MMSRFLHDSVGQNLTALGLQLDLIRMDLERAAPEVGARVAEVQKVLGEMMEHVREYSYELNPATVERAGLRAALDRLAVRSRPRFTGTLRVNVDPSLKIEPKLAGAIYQIAQEALENAVRHSGCSSVDILIKSSRNSTILEVRDNGRGFDPGDIQGSHRGLGLLSMEHYAAQAGMTLAIISAREIGTTVRAATG
jgi:signal transduction histidine kinase